KTEPTPIILPYGRDPLTARVETRRFAAGSTRSADGRHGVDRDQRWASSPSFLTFHASRLESQVP
ncbi:MAG: hypothetical protein ACXWOV_18585, partial [Isosphaeraceae bacterium]